MLTHSRIGLPVGANGTPEPAAISAVTRSAGSLRIRAVPLQAGHELAGETDARMNHDRAVAARGVVEQVVGELFVELLRSVPAGGGRRGRAVGGSGHAAGGVKTPNWLPAGSRRYAK